MQKSLGVEVERYLCSGEYDADFGAWPGENFLARARSGHAALRKALIWAIRQLTAHATLSEQLAGMDVVAFTRAKVAPMVRGLFPRCE